MKYKHNLTDLQGPIQEYPQDKQEGPKGFKAFTTIKDTSAVSEGKEN